MLTSFGVQNFGYYWRVKCYPVYPFRLPISNFGVQNQVKFPNKKIYPYPKTILQVRT